jgi:DNA (cytosine-5)-methyltransferase 1
MTFGSLFAGIGGMDLGLERAGMTCKWQVEIDPFCQKVLAKHWPEVPKYGDIRKLNGSELEWVDLVCGGFPCQDVSQIGHQDGITGTRSGLFWESIRILRHIRPSCFLLENVTGLLDRGMGEVLGALAESGYDAEWNCLRASSFGAPHKRERVFIVAYPYGIRREATEILSGLPKKSLEGWREWETFKANLYPWDGNRYFLESSPYSELFRLDDGIPEELALKAYGNAVVPQVAEWIGRRIIEAVEVPV